jgi:sensor histidine kinase regulating citrate/malate metabolism
MRKRSLPFDALIIVLIYNLRMGDLYDDFTVSSSRLELANKQIGMQKEYYTSLSRQMNEIREIKHDIKHFIGTMTQLAKEGNFERLRTFLIEYDERSQMDQLPVFCEHIIGNSIIGYYYLRAKEYGILFESKCYIPAQTIMSDSDLCIVLGNALDNAVCACNQIETTGPKYVSIEISEMKGQRLIQVANSYQGDLITEDGRYVSTKGGNSHGFGIQNITKVIEAYGGFVKIETKENVFTLRGAIPNK